LSYKTSAKRLGSNKRKEFEFEIQTLQYLIYKQTCKDFIQASEIHSELLFKECSCYNDTRGVTPRIWRGGRPTAPKMKGNTCKNRKNGSKVLPRLSQRRARGGGEGGGETPSELESSRDDDEDEEVGEIIFPCSLLPKNIPSRGDLFGWQMGPLVVPTGLNAPRWMPAGCPAYRCSPASRWYVPS
jgi:hypothetical protein